MVYFYVDNDLEKLISLFFFFYGKVLLIVLVLLKLLWMKMVEW